MERIVISGIGIQVPEGYKDAMGADSKEYQEIRLSEEGFQMMDRKSRKRLDRYIQNGMLSAAIAVNLSGIDLSEDADHIGIIAASSFGSVTTINEDVTSYIETGHISPLFIPKVVMNMFAGNLAIQFGVKGVNYTIGTGFNAAMDALIEGVELLQEKRAKAVIVCAAESAIGKYGKKLFQSYKADPFYEASSVYVEGSGAFVLETYENAIARNAHIYAEIAGYDTFFQKSIQKESRLSRLAGGKQIDGKAKVCGLGYDRGDAFCILESSDNCFGASHPAIYVKEAIDRIEQEEFSSITVYSMNAEGNNSQITLKRV
ncbi:beta-ketoacyl synthase N-terminal-like domain-containing protein [[Clostridium] polysaccharolyticum]|uniref:Beta-ketoacyl synthase, N-terminal domain n=1 Tax=[Clostridium] polysaccharolyticum TaxID=29364 RepID=A0A1H9YRR9_9FIRM|nr:beta-ketoacyl synthase N-terminal-like domain-containing protein [[Clostridium] polysaccharolyticum]SES71752.1 Beta-ketoacyl synthase, N-terminal domain [[Clostridium] polysaccharolyticum]